MHPCCRRLIVVMVLLTAALLRPAPAQDIVAAQTRPRLVSVTGEAEVKVVPDEVVLTLGLETSDADLAKAKQLNNDRVKGVMAIAREFKIEPRDVQVDYIGITPEYRRDGATFNVRRNMVVIIRDITKFEALLTRMVQNNRANRVHGIQFRTSELRKYRDQAREMAITAAREKATALAGALGAKIGKPYSIAEQGSNWWSGYGSYWGYNNYAMNAQVSMPGGMGYGGGGGTTFAPGQIAITAQISVSFELE